MDVQTTPVKEAPKAEEYQESTQEGLIPEVTILERQTSEGGDRGDEGIVEGPSISEEYEDALNAPNEEDSDDEDVSLFYTHSPLNSNTQSLLFAHSFLGSRDYYSCWKTGEFYEKNPYETSYTTNSRQR